MADQSITVRIQLPLSIHLPLPIQGWSCPLRGQVVAWDFKDRISQDERAKCQFENPEEMLGSATNVETMP
jgi:hypothetical protein